MTDQELALNDASTSTPSPAWEMINESTLTLDKLTDLRRAAFQQVEHVDWLHEQVRKDYWGYAASEALDSAGLIAEKYRGIRPAPGYPACPDHTSKGALFSLLEAPKNAGMNLTESYAMMPAASVAGFYLAHPDARYFAVGKIGRDQLQDWAQRAAMTVQEAERWLAPLL